jgi:hypothetical protein
VDEMKEAANWGGLNTRHKRNEYNSPGPQACAALKWSLSGWPGAFGGRGVGDPVAINFRTRFAFFGSKFSGLFFGQGHKPWPHEITSREQAMADFKARWMK